jgi:hypothetical protein
MRGRKFPGKHRLPKENLFETKLNRGNRMIGKKRREATNLQII